MSTLEQRVGAVLSEPLRDAAAGGALGYVGLDIPPDLLLAGNRVSCHLPLRIPHDTTDTAQWLESSFPPWSHAILESWWRGDFACFDHVIFSRGDDVSHRLYYYICELQRQGRIAGPQPLVFDVARIPRESSRRYSANALRGLAQQLQIDAAALRQGVARANEWRRLFAQVSAQRRGAGSCYERLVRASLYTDLPRLLGGAVVQGAACSGGGVVLAGSVPPDDRLHRAVEQAGWTVVEEFHDRGLGRLGDAVDDGAPDLPRAIVDRWLAHHFTARDLGEPAAALLATVKRTAARAAVLWCTRDDEALAWRVPALRKALDQAGIPVLVLVARSWAVDDGADLEIQAFLEGLPHASA
jgi:hypothetical protein